MNCNDLISVIVPVYNLEKYISRCIDSILIQTYHNLELILIDDGSTDNSLNVINSYKDNRIKVYSHKNQGPGYSRNKGLKLSKGEFITFIDGDDYVSKYYLEYMIQGLKKYNSDMAVCNYSINNLKHDTQMQCNHIANKKDIIEMMLQDPWKSRIANMNSGGKLVKRSLHEKYTIIFSEDKFLTEDIEYAQKCFLNAKSLTHIYNPLYVYYKRDTSLTSSSRNALDSCKGRLKYVENLNKLAHNQELSLLESIKNNAMLQLKIIIVDCLREKNTSYKRISRILTLAFTNKYLINLLLLDNYKGLDKVVYLGAKFRLIKPIVFILFLCNKLNLFQEK